ncbi:LytTR family DNA-binding domain-containing protein [Chitinimonas sp. BJYL2]|uniref:LytR/AlgR family response regulator transcription factor n=1 Tax=Chitinimonas sp. BJYL2 TaxID=2976696 RepID=UPI0022B32D77|nr:LytTR family DNA-binding domain-containing protein [Chitinimonas sp. BJYL2]
MSPTALIAEDEPLLRAQLGEALALLWPELQLVAEAADGTTALRAIAAQRPEIAFLDIRMPGLSGLDVARAAAGRCHVVFLTAYDEHAIAAFDAGAVDYLLKPLDLARLALAVDRLKARLATPPADLSRLLAKLGSAEPAWLRWIHAASGATTRIVAVEEVAGFVAEAKYTRVLGVDFDAHIRKTIKELAAELDPACFRQISRSAVIHLGRIERVHRDGSGGMSVVVGGATLTVSQPYQAQFRQM